LREKNGKSDKTMIRTVCDTIIPGRKVDSTFFAEIPQLILDISLVSVASGQYDESLDISSTLLSCSIRRREVGGDILEGFLWNNIPYMKQKEYVIN
jgi:hypothetical protein